MKKFLKKIVWLVKHQEEIEKLLTKPKKKTSGILDVCVFKKPVIGKSDKRW